MRICRISSASPIAHDGMAHHVLHLSRHQVRMGHHVTIVQPHPVPQVLGGIDIRRATLSAGRRYEARRLDYMLFCLCYASLLIKMHARQRFDLVHAHGDWLDALAIGLVGRAVRIPSVLTVHAGLNERLAYTVLGRFCLGFVDRIIAVSPDIALDLARRLKQSPSRVCCISSGIAWDLYSAPGPGARDRIRRDLDIPAEATVVLEVGTVSNMKGQRYLLEAADRLRSKADLFFVCVGAPEDPSALELMASAGPAVRFTGPRSPADVVGYLKAADIFALPSVDLRGKHEGTPTALMEAMAAGLPVVVTDSGGMPYLVDDGTNGYVVAQRDSEALAERIGRLALDPGLRRSMGERNRLKVKPRDWAAISLEVERVYRSAMISRVVRTGSTPEGV